MDNVEHTVNAGCLHTVAFHSVFLIHKSANVIQALYENVQGREQCRKHTTLVTRFMGPTWAHLGPTGPRWAPFWPHELCYLGSSHITTAGVEMKTTVMMNISQLRFTTALPWSWHTQLWLFGTRLEVTKDLMISVRPVIKAERHTHEQ